MIVLVGLNHKTAEIELREKFHFAQEELPEQLRALKNFPSVNEGLILSTCNRVEVFASVNGGNEGILDVKKFLASSRRYSPDHLEKNLYVHTEREAIMHVFRVTSSLDSMVVGEPQILGQVKEAFRVAMDTGTTGATLNRCMHRAFHVAKRVRTETAIARHPVSVSSVAVELATKIFDRLSDQVVLLVGAGEMIQETALRLSQSGVTEILVTSRTHAHASEIAERFQGTTFFLEKLSSHLPRADIVIACTSAVEPILTREMIAKVMSERQGRPLFLIDLSVPRNIEEGSGKMEGVYLYNIDDFSAIVADNLKRREKEVHEAEAILASECEEFAAKLSMHGSLPVIATLNERAEAIGRQELEKTLKKFPGISSEQMQSLRAMNQSIIRKILHAPIEELRIEAQKDSGEESFYHLVRRLFRL